MALVGVSQSTKALGRCSLGIKQQALVFGRKSTKKALEQEVGGVYLNSTKQQRL